MKSPHFSLDYLGYVDYEPTQDEISHANQIIEKEIQNVDKDKFDQLINEKYNLQKIHEPKLAKAIDFNINYVPNKKFTAPPMSKYYNEESWRKILNDVRFESEKLRDNILGIEMKNKYDVKLWDLYLDKFNFLIQGLKKEKETLQEEISFINKKRKFNQYKYKEELLDIEEKTKEKIRASKETEKEMKE